MLLDLVPRLLLSSEAVKHLVTGISVPLFSPGEMTDRHRPPKGPVCQSRNSIPESSTALTMESASILVLA